MKDQPDDISKAAAAIKAAGQAMVASADLLMQVQEGSSQAFSQAKEAKEPLPAKPRRIRVSVEGRSKSDKPNRTLATKKLFKKKGSVGESDPEWADLRSDKYAPEGGGTSEHCLKNVVGTLRRYHSMDIRRDRVNRRYVLAGRMSVEDRSRTRRSRLYAKSRSRRPASAPPKPKIAKKDVISRSVARQIAKVGEATVAQAIKSGELVQARVNGRPRITLESFEPWYEKIKEKRRKESS